MRVRDKINTLQVGDAVVVYMEYTSHHEPREGQISKTGKKYLYVNNMRFSKETGSAEYGYQIFPGTMDEFKAWKINQERARRLASELSRKIYGLSSEELDIIDDDLLDDADKLFDGIED